MNESDFSKDIEINNKSDVCVFLFHGLSATPFELKTWAEEIAELGIDVKAPLLPNHGVDSDLLCSVESAGIFYDFGKKYIDTLKKRYQTVIGLGISLGAGTIFDYVGNKGGKLDALILLATGVLAAKELKLLYWLVRIFNLKAMKNPFTNEYEKSLFPSEYFNWKMQNFPKVPVKMLMKTLYKQKTDGISEKLSKIECPIMIVNGTTGLLTNRKSVDLFFDIIPSKKKYGLLLEGATHTVHKSQYNIQILEHIIKFISEIIESIATEKEIEGKEIIVLKD